MESSPELQATPGPTLSLDDTGGLRVLSFTYMDWPKRSGASFWVIGGSGKIVSLGWYGLGNVSGLICHQSQSLEDLYCVGAHLAGSRMLEKARGLGVRVWV